MTKLAAIQLSTTDNFEANLISLQGFIHKAYDNGAQHIFTPENSDIMLSNKMLETFDFSYSSQKFIDFIQNIALKLKVTIHVGSIKIPTVVSVSKTYNQSISINHEGNIVARYNKIHLFDASVAGDSDYRESNTIQAGENPQLCDFGVFKLGYSICYDVRFPYLYEYLSEKGATIIAIPAAFTEKTGKAHWEMLVRARAIENSCYVVAAAQVGLHFGKRKTYGNSLIVSPWGDILGHGDSFFEDIIYADYSKEALEEVRMQINSLKHRRKIPVNT